MTLKLRPIQKDDLEAATQIGLAAWISAIAPALDTFDAAELPKIEQAFKLFLLSHIAGEHAATDVLTVATIGGQIVGFCNIDCSKANLTDLWIAPQWQGQGIAAALMHNAKDRARKIGHPAMILEVLAKNQRAIAFYKKEGLEEYGRSRQFDPVLERAVDKILMRIELH